MTAATEARDRLRAASYRTGQPQYADRCETCTHCDSTPLRQHGRYCENHRAEVRTHGVCVKWEEKR